MKLKFDITTWQTKKGYHQLMVTSETGLIGWNIRLIVSLDNNIQLQLPIKNKQDLITFWELMHIAGVMMSKGEIIDEVDRVYFKQALEKIGVEFITVTEAGKSIQNSKIDQYAKILQKYGRDLWQLLGESNLMFLLS